VVAAGASPDRVEVTVEIDSQRNRIRATASGATALAEPVTSQACDEAGRRAAAARSLGREELKPVELTEQLSGYRSDDALAVVDDRGIVRLVLHGASVLRTPAGTVEESAYRAIERDTRFGDVGRALPALYLLRRERIATYDGLAAAAQAVAL